MSEYPKWRYKKGQPNTLVNSKEEEKVLGPGWGDSPAFDPPAPPTPAELVAKANADAARAAAEAKAKADAAAKAGPQVVK